MKTLLVVDVQNDFCEGGALGAPGNDEVVPVINRILPHFNYVLASKDWHPENSVHFEKWPVHCVKNTKGAEFHPELNTSAIDKVLLKGTHDKDDGYSAFEATTDNLVDLLKKKDEDTIYVAGLTTDYCVKDTVLDALSKGFKVKVVEDAIRAVNVNPGDGDKAIREMEEHGADFVLSKDLL